MQHIVIVGNGITGITTARNLRKKSDAPITVISSETPFFYSRTALMYIYMGHMTYEDTKPYEDGFWKKNNITLKHGHVKEIDPSNTQILLDNGDSINYGILVIATGSKSNTFGWPGQDLKGVQGLYNLNDIQTLEKNTKDIDRGVIVGGGLIGIEMAEMLLSRNIAVSFLVRENHFWNIVLPDEEAMLIERHLREHHVDLKLSTELKEILPGSNGNVRGILTNKNETISCQFVGLTVGVSPNIEFLTGSEIETDRGILVNEFFETNIDNVYAGGDCAQFKAPLPGRRPVEQVWYTGRMHGEHIAANICGAPKPYEPGIWFNSAKFFDIEYQTYGLVPGKLPDDQDTFYWEHPSGKKSIRINYRKSDQSVTGFNLFGIRGRHAVCEHWIAEKCSLAHVLQNLGAMNFDPEFFIPFENECLTHYNGYFQQENVNLKTPKGLFSSYISSIFNKNAEKGKQL